MTELRDLKWFDSLKRRDFENGAVLDEIRDVFKARESIGSGASLGDALDRLESLVDYHEALNRLAIFVLDTEANLKALDIATVEEIEFSDVRRVLSWGAKQGWPTDERLKHA